MICLRFMIVDKWEILNFKWLQYLWRIGDKGLYPNYPAEITRMWNGLPMDLTHVDAVYERLDNKIVFFIGKYYKLLISPMKM